MGDKKLRDFADEMKVKIPEITAKVKENASLLSDALADLLALEKKTRLAADGRSTSDLAIAILDLCFSTSNFSLLNDHISILSKRRAQLQKVQETIVQHAAKFVEKISDNTTKRALIEQIRAVSAGKIFVELERARLTKTLAQMEEAEGKIAEAADILQEVQVETIGTMEAKEKAEFLLDQIRLCLLKKDYVRTEIIAKKVDTKLINTDAAFAEIKVRFYKLQIQYFTHFSSYFQIAQAWRQIYNTPAVQNDPIQFKEALSKLVIFSLLSPFDAEISDILAILAQEKKLSQLPAFKTVLEQYRSEEIMPWPLTAEKEWRQDGVFVEIEGTGSSSSVSSSMAVDTVSSSGKTKAEAESKQTQRNAAAVVLRNNTPAGRWDDLHKSVVQHNIRVISKYYEKITSKRLAQLLQLDEQKSEDYLSEMVSSGQLWAKIDRPIGEITFAKNADQLELVNEWSSDISNLLQLIESTCHLINKENMVHKLVK